MSSVTSDTHSASSDRKLPQRNFEPTFDKDGIPMCLRWTCVDVEDYVEHLGLPQYRECFKSNYIDGSKMILMDASALPKIGITDFEHIKKITTNIRSQLGAEEPFWNRSISLPPREPNTHFLERKSHSGAESKSLTYEEHLRYLKEFNQHGVPPNQS